MPRSACSNLPICFSVAPVNEPFSWPNSSDSISSSGIAAQLTWTNRCAGARAVAVDGARDELLADAALARAAARWRWSARRARPPRAPAAAPGSRRRSGTSTPSPACSVAVLRRAAADWSSAFCSVTSTRSLLSGFSRKSKAPELGSPRRPSLIVPWPGDHHDRQRLVDGAQLSQHLDAVHARHLDVEQDEVAALALGQREAFLAGGGADELVVLVLEDHPQRVADGGLVVDDQDARIWASGWRVSGRRRGRSCSCALLELGLVDVERQDVAGPRGARSARR